MTSIAVDPTDGNAIFATLGGALGFGDRVWHRASGAAAGPGRRRPARRAGQRARRRSRRRQPALGRRPTSGCGSGTTRRPPVATRSASTSPTPPCSTSTCSRARRSCGRRRTGAACGSSTSARTTTPAVELVLRTNRLDTRRRPARAGVKLPGDLGHQTRLDESPDIVVDAPDSNGVYAIDPSPAADLVQLLDRAGANTVLASVPEAPAITRVHVVVRNRGVRPANPALDARAGRLADRPGRRRRRRRRRRRCRPATRPRPATARRSTPADGRRSASTR